MPQTEVLLTALAVKLKAPKLRVLARVYNHSTRTLLKEAGVDICQCIEQSKLVKMSDETLLLLSFV